MSTSKLSRAAKGISLLLSLAFVSLIGCTGSNTDGGKAANTASNTFPQFVSDGGAGSTLLINVPTTIATGSTAGFSVTATDPTGAPLAFVRIFCETELGLALLEPSSGGTGFESTNGNGLMSGLLGGLTPGSYIIECRAPQGFNLVVRASVKVVGDVPEGFGGFPGAAGGNLGGGLLVDQTEDPSANGSVFISSVTFTDAGGETAFGPIDTFLTTDCDGDSTTSDPEPFTFTNFTVKITNDSLEDVSIETATIALTGLGSTSTQSVTALIPANSSASFTGLLITFSGGSQVLVGTGASIVSGDFSVLTTITGTTESGSSITLTDNSTLSFAPVNNCP